VAAYSYSTCVSYITSSVKLTPPATLTFAPTEAFQHPFRLMPYPDVRYKVELSKKDKSTIKVHEAKFVYSTGKTLPKNKIIEIANKYYLPNEDVIIILDDKYREWFVGDKSCMSCCEEIYSKLPVVTIEGLNALIDKHKNDIRDKICLITLDNDAKYISTTYEAKLYLPFFDDWIELKYPGLLSHEGSEFDSKILKLMFQLFLNSIGSRANAINITLPTDNNYRLNPEVIKDICVGVELSKEQIKNLPKSVGVSREPIHPTNRDGKVYNIYNEDVLTDIEMTEKPTEMAKVSFVVFYHCKGLFNTQCNIVLGEDEVVLNPEGKIVFYSPIIAGIKYFGPAFTLLQFKNSLEIKFKGKSAPPEMIKNISDYCSKFLSITNVKFSYTEVKQ